MSRAYRFGPIAIAALAVVSLAIAASGQDRSGRSKFMREKLDHSTRILNGLVEEDYEEIIRGARALRVMRDSPEWSKFSRPEAGRYQVYSRELESSCEDLIARANAKNIDGATLAYLRLTMNCVNCHKEIRSGGR